MSRPAARGGPSRDVVSSSAHGEIRMEQNVGLFLASAGQVVVATVCLAAGLAKVRAVDGLRDTIERLGASPPLARASAPAVVGVELLTAIALVTMPAAMWPRLSVAVLGIGFAVAGLVAVRTRVRVACACFGNAGRRMLGWRQVRLLPAWLGLAALAQSQPPGWSWRDGLAVLAFILLALIGWHQPAELRLVRELLGDRLAIAPIYRRSAPNEEEVPE